jgi:hypothetical protein
MDNHPLEEEAQRYQLPFEGFPTATPQNSLPKSKKRKKLQQER